MPLRHARTARTIRANISRNIATERRSGRPIKQAVAIAFSTARRDAKKAHVKLGRLTGRRRGNQRR